ncbi:heme-degrading domain-containing protein [Massilia sp. PAMC28688]|uniref:heme-degrading domain-containing protein n=1 Tax=Massilia sp. PAMC28688 TaxID=2861283 RepID=UPI001C6282FD|nr:heme-degrading domain-containing protein [Massilia sp. PAMC28688]QYF92597.1 heme-degrading domain-containing protein [Massilia sp. PAMC28688]
MKAPLFTLLLSGAAAAANPPAVRVNQLGFAPAASKVAVVPAGAAKQFAVIDTASGKAVLRGALGKPSLWEPSGETVRIADFSALRAPGTYRLEVAGLAPSAGFAIQPAPYRSLNAAALKAYYFNRSGTALDARHAGIYARGAGHPDDKVLVHATAASIGRPAGTVIAAPKGWYDAGDYNKYMPSSGIATFTLLAALEHFPRYFQDQEVGIPESGNGIPDILDEALWNLAWMLAMQDPADGGVYHKLTNLTFDAMVMPAEAMAAPRYVTAKSTSAALNFAATMAVASRVMTPYEHKLPGLSARMLAAAEAAWRWARANPSATFKNPDGVLTGEYGDQQLDDEWAWAAAELFISTRQDDYYRAFKPAQGVTSLLEWDKLDALAWMSLAHHRASLPAIADRALIAKRSGEHADNLARAWKASGYRVAMRAPDFVWGSGAVALNQSMLLLQAYRIKPKDDYLQAAQSGLDYVLGRNPLGYSFVTGFGQRTPLHPHHRPSVGDQVAAPIPGFLAGGPNPMQQDKAECPPYPSKLPALAYLDHVCSYASNEVAINWNAPLVYVTAALDELSRQDGNGMDQQHPSLAALARQEQALQFDSFTSATALDIGMQLVKMARAAGKSVAIDITRNGNQLFYHGMEGTTRDHADWIRRKSNLVNRTGHSSFFVHTQVRSNGGDHDNIPTMDTRDFAAHGGSFPLSVRGAGHVGTITVSGLPGPEDHQLVVDALKAYLKGDPTL